MTDEKLKPCPFCGGEAWTLHTGESVEMTVCCMRCDSAGPERERLSEAVRDWNRRPGENAAYRAGVIRGVEIAKERISWRVAGVGVPIPKWDNVDRAVREEVEK